MLIYFFLLSRRDDSFDLKYENLINLVNKSIFNNMNNIKDTVRYLKTSVTKHIDHVIKHANFQVIRYTLVLSEKPCS